MVSERVSPDKSLNEGNNNWEFYSKDKLGVDVLALKSDKTGAMLATLHGDKNIKRASIEAWAGSRHSRAPGDTVDILQEIVDKSVDSDQRLESTFKAYGHASVADMARIQIQFNDVPMHLAMHIFNQGTVNNSQEKSTRYQKKFGKGSMHSLNVYLPGVSPELEIDYQNLGKMGLDNFNNQKPIVADAYGKFYKPDNDNSSHKAATDSRILDTIRGNLPLGSNTGFAHETSARDWGRVISSLKSSPVEYYRNIGEQIESILAPSEEIEKTLGIRAEAPLLVKYTKADNTVKNNLTAIRNYLDTRGLSKSFIPEKLDIRFVPQNVRFLNEMSTPDKLVVQYIMAAYPGTQLEKAADVMYNLSREQISDISEIIFKDHTKYNEMPQQIATPQELTLLLAGTLGEARDFNRHRAWGRFMPDVPLFNGPEINSYMFDAILNKGYGLCSYVTDVPEFKHLKDMICEGFDKYYSKLVDFKTEIEKEYGKDIDYTFMMNTLPLGHNSDIIMHGNIKQAHYMTHLRVRNGGLINYRQMAYDAAKLISEHDPVYKRMMPPGNRPDASNRDQFLDRS